MSRAFTADVTRLAFTASDRPEAQEALATLTARYGQHPEESAEVVVALGGDGFMWRPSTARSPMANPSTA